MVTTIKRSFCLELKMGMMCSSRRRRGHGPTGDGDPGRVYKHRILSTL